MFVPTIHSRARIKSLSQICAMKLRFLLRQTAVDSDFTQNIWVKIWRVESLFLIVNLSVMLHIKQFIHTWPSFLWICLEKVHQKMVDSRLNQFSKEPFIDSWNILLFLKDSTIPDKTYECRCEYPENIRIIRTRIEKLTWVTWLTEYFEWFPDASARSFCPGLTNMG